MPNPDEAKSHSTPDKSINQTVVGTNGPVQGNVNATMIAEVQQQHVNGPATQHIAHIQQLIAQTGVTLNLQLLESTTAQIAQNSNAQSELLQALAKPQQTQQLINSIKEKYRQDNTLPDMLGGPILTLKEGCYVNLALIKSDEQIAKEQSLKQQSKPDSESTSNHTQRDNRLSSFEDIHRPKDPLPLNQLFVTKLNKHSNTTADKPIQRVLMLGRAGIGKSTLCQYLAYRWADDNKTEEEAWLKEYDVLLWIKLRELLTHAQSYEKHHKHFGVVDAVTKSCVSNLYSSNNTTITDVVNDLIHDSAKKVLWVLDGFDEVAHLYGDEKHSLHKVLHELFPRAATPAPLHQVLLTSRPYASQGLQVDRTIENIGLLDDDIPRYVTQYFNKLSNPNPDLGEKVTTQIKTNTNIHGMTHVPINAYLICHLYQKESKIQREDTSLKSFTLTQLYQRLVVDLCKRMVNQPQCHPPESNNNSNRLLKLRDRALIHRYQKPLWVLAHLAFSGLTQTQSLTLTWTLQDNILDTLDYEVDDYVNNVLPLGLLKTICETSEDTTEAPRYFMHLTFQEFFAALYLVWSLAEYGQAASKHKDQALNFLKNDKYTPRYQVIFWFAAGLVRDATWFNNECTIQQTALTNLWEKGFLSEPQDITGYGQFHLLAHGFEEGGEPTSLSTPLQNNPINTAWTFIKDAIDKTLVSRVIDNKNARLFKPLFTTLTVCPHLSNNHAQPLIKYLQHDNTNVRSSALTALTDLNVTNSNTLQLIAEYLKHEDPGVRQSVLGALAKLNVTDSHSLQLIAQRLDDKDQYVRRSALDAFAKLNVTDSHSLQLIAKCLEDNNEDVRESALDAFAKLNVTDSHTLQLIAKRLDDKNKNVRYSALDAFAKLNGTDSHSLQLIAERLDDNDWQVRSRALDAFAKLNGTDSHSLQLIAQRLDDNDWQVRSSALNALAQLNVTDSHTLQRIAERLDDKKSRVRRSALDAFAKLNGTDSHSLQLIAERLTDKKSRVCESALKALAQLNGIDSHTLQLIAQRLEDKDQYVRASALYALAQLNIFDANTLQLIAQRLEDKDQYVRASALYALAQLNVTDSHSLQLIAQRLDDNDWQVRSRALKALAKLNVTDAHTIQLIAQRLDDNDWQVRSSALDALAQLNGIDSHTLQLIAERLEDKDLVVRSRALKALAKLNVTDSHSLQLIAQRLDDNYWRVRSRALKALAQLNVTDAHTLQLIAQRLDDNYWRVRSRALKALAQLNVTDAHTLQLIAQRLDDDDWQVHPSAVKALNRLQPHLTMECWLPVWDKRLADESKGALSATTAHRLMTAWITELLSAATNSYRTSHPSLLKISRLFAKWIFDWLQLPLVIDEKQHSLNMITAESTDTLSIPFPDHPLGQTAFKRCQQALELESFINPVVPFPGYTHLHTQHLDPEHRFNALQQHLEHYFNTNEDFDFDYILQNTLYTYASLFEQKPELWEGIIDLVLKHPLNDLSNNPILHHIYKTTPIETLMEARNKRVYELTSQGDEYGNKSKLNQAIQQYEQAVMVDPNDSTPYHNLACFYHTKAHSISADEAHQYCELAEHSFNKALKRNPAPQLYAEYGQFLYIQQRYEKALPLLTQAIKTSPNVIRTHLRYNSLKRPTLDTTLQAWLQSHEIIEINSAQLAYYLKYRCYEVLGQTQKQAAWLNEWAEWLASIPNESCDFFGHSNYGYPVSQHLLTTCQNEQAAATVHTTVHPRTTKVNDESPTHTQAQPLETQHSTTEGFLSATQPKLQTTTAASSVKTVIHEHWQYIMASPLGHPVRRFNIHTTPTTPLPSSAPTKPSYEITSNNEEDCKPKR